MLRRPIPRGGTSTRSWILASAPHALTDVIAIEDAVLALCQHRPAGGSERLVAAGTVSAAVDVEEVYRIAVTPGWTD